MDATSLLAGAVDTHVHSAPDTGVRVFDADGQPSADTEAVLEIVRDRGLVEGMEEYVRGLLEHGIGADDVRRMVGDHARTLLEL